MSSMNIAFWLFLAMTNLSLSFAQPVSVKSFGAVGDGSTDDSAAFQRALNTGKPIIVGAGRFKISKTLFAPASGLSIQGAGLTNTAIILAGGLSRLFHVTRGTLNLRDLWIQGAKGETNEPHKNGRLSAYKSLIYWIGLGPGKSSIQNVGFRYCPQFCIVTVELNSELKIHGSTFSFIPHGSSSGNGTSLYETGAILINRGKGGVIDFQENVVSNPPSQQPGGPGGIQIHSSIEQAPFIKAIISKNQFTHIGSPDYTNGGSLYAAVDIYSQVHQAIISDNLFVGSTGAPIKIANSNSVQVLRNRIFGRVGLFTQAAISYGGCSRGSEYCSSEATDVLVSGNHIKDFGASDGIFFSAGILKGEQTYVNKVRVVGNTIQNTDVGIRLHHTDSPIVQSNTVTGFKVPYDIRNTRGASPCGALSLSSEVCD